jgi:DNA-binding response OmpR family regulator
MAEVDALEKIIFNYLSNALKYTNNLGSIEIKLIVKDGRAKVEVTDTGVGISESDQKKLFEVFSQVGDKVSREYEGTGLGLALVKELATQMNAEVGVRSEMKDFGSTFWVSFKIASDKSKRILDIVVVESDEERNRFLTKFIDNELPSLNCKSFKSINEARRIFKEFDTKCIILSGLMPEDENKELFDWLAKESSETKRVLFENFKEEKSEVEENSDLIEYYHLYRSMQKGELKEQIMRIVESSSITTNIPADLEMFTPKGWLLENPDKQTDAGSGSSSNSPVDEDMMSGDGEVILVVDDLQDMRRFISKIVSSHGYRIITAINGEDALEKIKTTVPDLIVTDWMMPRMSGVELVQKVKADEKLKGIPMVLLTAKSDEESKTIGIDSGADGFIGKPFSEMELISVVRNNLRLKQREREVELLNYNLSKNILKRYIPIEKLEELQSGKNIFSEKAAVSDICVINFDIPQFDFILKEKGIGSASAVINDYINIVSSTINEFDGFITNIDTSDIMAIYNYSNKFPPQESVKKIISTIQEVTEKVAEINILWRRRSI